jgi:hypothetical protein
MSDPLGHIALCHQRIEEVCDQPELIGRHQLRLEFADEAIELLVDLVEPAELEAGGDEGRRELQSSGSRYRWLSSPSGSSSRNYRNTVSGQCSMVISNGPCWLPSTGRQSRRRSRRGDSNSQPTVYKIPERVISGALWCGRIFSRSACVPPCDRGCRSCRGTLRGTRWGNYQPIKEIGEAAVEQLFQRVAYNRSMPTHRITLECRLQIRESSAASRTR